MKQDEINYISKISKLIPQSKSIFGHICDASDNFVSVFLEHYLSYNIIEYPEITKIIVSNISKKECLELNILFSRVDMFGYIKKINKNLYELTLLKSYVSQNDIVLDPIISIEPISSKSKDKYKKVYDLTVPDTLNFGLVNGLHVVDTADTGYNQKKIVKKVENYKTKIDGTVRDSENNIIQFFYGGDGMSARKLVNVVGLECPFFVNPYIVANILNTRYELEFNKIKREYNNSFTTREIKRKTNLHKSPKRVMSEDEIELLCTFIYAGSKSCQNQITKCITKTFHIALTKLLQNVELYEDVIPEFCLKIRDALESSKIPPEEFVGNIAAMCVGEIQTQLSAQNKEIIVLKLLNCFTNKETYFNGKIGDFIDQLFNDKEKINIVCDVKECGIATIKDEYEIYIITVNPENEKCEWAKLCEISRHPCNGGLIKVTTNSGRTITTTLSHSHLKRINKDIVGIVPIKGSELKVGDTIPVLKNIQAQNNINHIFTNSNRKIDLDYDFGVIVGLFLSGWPIIYKLDKSFQSAYCFIYKNYIYNFCHKYNIVYDYPNSNLIRLYLDDIFDFLLENFSNETSHVIPGFTFFSPKEFIDGIHLGYFYFFGLNSKSMINETDIVNLSCLSSLFCQIGIFCNITKDEKCYYISIDKEITQYDEENLKPIQNTDYNACWDKIVKIEYLDDPNEFVYDLGVTGVHTFMNGSGIFTHNTLNFFHNAGLGEKDVSQGIPRMKELFDRTKNPAKPSSTIYMDKSLFKERKDTIEQITKQIIEVDEKIKNTPPPLKKRKNKVSESEKLHKEKETLNETLQKEHGLLKNDVFTFHSSLEYVNVEMVLKMSPESKRPQIKMMYLPGKHGSPLELVTFEEYKQEWWVSLYNDLNKESKKASSWVLLLELDLNQLYKYQLTTEQIAEKIEQEIFEDNPLVICIPSPNCIGQIEVYMTPAFLTSKIANKKKKNIQLEALATGTNDEDLKEKVLINEDNEEFFFARDILLEKIKKVYLKGIEGIKKTYLNKDYQSGEYFIDASGRNLLKLLTYLGIDSVKTVTDDIWEIYNLLGIEAVRTFLIKEMTRVISFDGTYINQRHITILVDSMTHKGTVTSINRYGIDSSVGPVTKGTFEKNVDNFIESSCFTEYDDLTSVPGAIMFGTLSKGGDTMVELYDTDRIPVNISNTQ
jgi:hypothetical protein